MSVVFLQEGGDRGTPALALARVRVPSDTTNGTSSSKGTSHSKGQRSSSSTYHRQRRHSDFCECYPMPAHAAPTPRPQSCGTSGFSGWQATEICSSQLHRREGFLIKMKEHCMELGGRNSQPGSGKFQKLEKTGRFRADTVSCFFSAHLVFPFSQFLISQF